MKASLRALLTGIIDYAGMFPPASLSLDESIRNHARYRREPESWMLGRFICPADKLDELSGHVPRLFGGGPALKLSVLIGGGQNSEDCQTNLQRDSKQVRDFEIRHLPHEATIDTFEVRVPPDYSPFAHDVQEFGRECFWELPSQGHLRVRSVEVGWDQEALSHGFKPKQTVFLMIGNVVHALDLAEGPHCLKLRCGGTEAAAFPSPERVAMVIATGGLIQARLKFTAGLHHPIRHFDPGLQVKMHGFINVFVAGVLTHARRLDEAALRGILEDEDPASFRFDDQALHWKDLSASVDEISSARRFVTSFGSCSFDEPRDDLRRLGWL